MKKIWIFSLIVLGFFSLNASADGVPSPHIYKPEFEAITNLRKECKKNSKTYALRTKCGREGIERLSANGQLRGSVQYSEKNYFPMNTALLEVKLKELKKLKVTARSPIQSDRGEVTKRDYASEISHIEMELYRRKFEDDTQNSAKDS